MYTPFHGFVPTPSSPAYHPCHPCWSPWHLGCSAVHDFLSEMMSLRCIDLSTCCPGPPPVKWSGVNDRGFWEKLSPTLLLYQLDAEQGVACVGIKVTQDSALSPALWMPRSTHWQWRAACGIYGHSAPSSGQGCSGNGARVAHSLK